MAMKDNREIIEDAFFDEDDEDTQKDKFLTFQIEGQDYGIEIGFVIEIVGISKIATVPNMPDFVKGVINLRGNIIPIIDIRSRFKLNSRPYDDRTCVVVVIIEDITLGMIVDTVSDVLSIPEGNIVPPPKVHKGHGSRFIKGMATVQDDVKILLDINKLLFEEELQEISAVENNVC